MKRNEIEQLLPAVFQRTSQPGSVLRALLEVMEALQAPSEDVLAELDRFFDPYRCPDEFVPYLAGWVDLDRFQEITGDRSSLTVLPFPTGIGRLRELIAAAAYLSTWRGTAKGLIRFLETATGIQGYTVEEQVPGDNGLPRPFHLRVRAPAAIEVQRRLIERIIEAEKPAYVTYELVFAS